MIGEKTEERRLFTREERLEILKKSYGICACCGKKLTTKTLRVEHVIPLSRGGKNEMENLTALCEDCNKWKDNKIYMPCDFYAALRDKPRFHEMERYVREWFDTVKEDFDLERFPMISFNIFTQLNPVPNSTQNKTPKFNRQLMYKWSMVGEFMYQKVERLTGLRIQDIRKKMRSIEQNGKTVPKNHPIPLYCLQKVTTDKILILIAVSYWKDHGLAIYVPWYCMGKNYVRSMVYNFIFNILSSLDLIAGHRISSYCICSEQKEPLEAFIMQREMPELIGTEYRYGYYEYEDGSKLHIVEVSRRPRIFRTLRPSNLEGKGD